MEGVLQLVKGFPSMDNLNKLNHLISSGEIRDYDEYGLFENSAFYDSLSVLMSSVLGNTRSSIIEEPLALKSYPKPRIGIPSSLTRLTKLSEAAKKGPVSITSAPWLNNNNNSKNINNKNININKQRKIEALNTNQSTNILGPSTKNRSINIYKIYLGILKLPEYNGRIAVQTNGAGLVTIFSKCCQHLLISNQANPKTDNDPLAEKNILRDILYYSYKNWKELRMQLFPYLTKLLKSVLHKQCWVCVNEILDIVIAIIQGLNPPLNRNVYLLLKDGLLPLYTPNQNKLEEPPVIEVYSKRLTLCIRELIVKTPSWFNIVIKSILDSFPPPMHAHAAKEVQLLHDLEYIIECANIEQYYECSDGINQCLIKCTNSDFARLAQRALSIWKNESFATLSLSTLECREEVYNLFLPIILCEPHWNRTVNKMRYNVIDIFNKHDNALFNKCIDKYWKQHRSNELKNRTPLQATNDLMNVLYPIEDRKGEEVKVDNHIIKVPEQFDNIKYTDFVFGHILGTGAISKVRYAKKIKKMIAPSKWDEYAIKVVDKNFIKVQSYENNLKREIQVMNQLCHPNITRLLGVCESYESFYLVMEYANNGDLFSYISSLGSLKIDSVKFISAEIILGLEHLHQNNIIYIDLKPENILVHHNFHMKLCDFGSARYNGQDILNSNRLDGTAEYTAPEVVNGELPSFTSDIWALGCVIYQMIVGRTPVWSEETEIINARDDVLKKMVHFDIETEFSEDFPNDAKDLIMKLMNKIPSKRPTFNEIKEHVFFKDIDFHRIHEQKPPTMNRGINKPRQNKAWSRRKFSMMWAPMPENYDFNSTSSSTRYPIIEE